MSNQDNTVQDSITMIDRLENLLRHDGLPEGVSIEELEELINSTEALLETANELFDKVG